MRHPSKITLRIFITSFPSAGDVDVPTNVREEISPKYERPGTRRNFQPAHFGYKLRRGFSSVCAIFPIHEAFFHSCMSYFSSPTASSFGAIFACYMRIFRVLVAALWHIPSRGAPSSMKTKRQVGRSKFLCLLFIQK